MRYKRGKLLLNLLNVVEALCGPFDCDLEIEESARAEAIACFEAAGLEYTIDETRFIGVKQSGEAPFLRTGDLGFRHEGESTVTS